MNLYEKVGEVSYDNLFAGTSIPVEVRSVKLAANQGILVRGTVLAIETATGAAKIADSTKTGGIEKADCVLTDTIDTGTTEPIVSTAYSSGLFNRNALIVADADTVEKHEEILRMKGIYLKDNLSY